MKVDILQATDHPIGLISMAAGCCYGKGDEDGSKMGEWDYDIRNTPNSHRVENCFKMGHMSVFEHANVTFRVSDISRACSHQLVRHRLASYSQRSQRYTKLTMKDLQDGNWYVIPPDILQDGSKMDEWDYEACMRGFITNYLGAISNGVKPEDARFLLPEATKTEIVCTMNLREIYHFLDLRYSKKAQWEIRELAVNLFTSLKDLDSQWYKLMVLWENRSKKADILSDEDEDTLNGIRSGMVSEASLLENLAEECSELAHAALKLSRCLRGENPTPVNEPDARKKCAEEANDVIVLLKSIGFEPDSDILSEKIHRWDRRLMESNSE